MQNRAKRLFSWTLAVASPTVSRALAVASPSLLAALAVASPGVASAGWPFFADGPKLGSSEYYCEHANDPVGERQKCHHGKAWPPFNRPCGPEQTCVHKFHAAHYWPYPYNIQDRTDVRLALQTQVANGWATATTMYDYHFDPTTQQLNSAGMQHLGWIYTQTPPDFRHVYIATSADPAFNEARTATIQKAIAGFGGAGASMPISMRYTGDLGRPAPEVEQIFSNAATNALPPKIEYQAVGTAAGGGN